LSKFEYFILYYIVLKFVNQSFGDCFNSYLHYGIILLIMIDKIDILLLTHLSRDASISNSRLAQKAGINVATVARRIDEMIEKGLITIKAVPDSIKLGYQVKAVMALKVDWTGIDSLIARLKEHPGFLLMVTTFGRFDLLMIAGFPDWAGLNTLLETEINPCRGVKKTDIFFIGESKKTYRGLFDSTREAAPGQAPDEVDLQIIAALGKDGRASHTDIARKLGISQATVSRRISQLLKNNLIKILAVPNPARFGSSTNAFILLNTEPGCADRICVELSAYPQVYGSMTLTCGPAILLYGQFKNNEALHQFIRENTARIRGVNGIEVLVVAEYLKTTYESMDFDFET
jgi:DNA-binding Lrp family transcriptional regulator